MDMGNVSDDDISLTSTVGSDQQSEYEVETILAEHEDAENGLNFLVKWDGYSDDRCTWEPAESFINGQETLLEWNEKKRKIALGQDSPFDVAALEARWAQVEEDRNERKRRRAAKRRKLGSTGANRIIKGASSVQASIPRRPNPDSKSASSNDHVHPPRRGLVPLAPKPPVGFGNGQTKAADPMRPKKLHIPREPRHFTYLSTKRKYEKTKHNEPAPNIHELDLRRPSDWESANPAQVGSSRLNPVRRDTADSNPTGYGNGLSIGSPTLSQSQASPITSPRVSNSGRNIWRPERNETSYGASRNPTAKLRAPIGEFRLEFPPRKPTFYPKYTHKYGGRWWNFGEIFVTIFFGPDKQEIGCARLCGIPRYFLKNIMYTKVDDKIEVWFRYLYTLEEYHELCDHTSKNVKLSNGWVEGFNDTEPKIRNAAEKLWQNNLIAIAQLNSKLNGLSSEDPEVLLAYPPGSPSFNFLDDNGTVNGYLNIALRTSLGPLDGLNLRPRHPGSHLTELNNTTPSGQSNTSKVTRPSGVKVLGNFEVAQENVLPSPTASFRTGMLDAVVPIRPPVPSKPSSQLANSPLQEAVSLPIEPMDPDIRRPQGPAPHHNGTELDLKTSDIDSYFRNQLGITFEALATQGGTEKSQRKVIVYIWFPEVSENVTQERDLIFKFLKPKTKLLYSNRVEEDWERFVMTCSEANMQGVILFHESFMDYHKVPSLKSLTRKATSFWNVSLLRPLQYVDIPLHFQRLFPHGCVFLITEDFMTRDPEATMVILEWFSDYVKKRFPGTYKMMFRPDVLNWVLKQLDVDGSRQSNWLAIYHLINKLASPSSKGSLSNTEDDESIVIPLSQLPNYGFRSADDSPEIPKNANQHYRNTDHLAEFFAGWGLVNAHRFRRFVMVTTLEPLKRWSEWHHIEIRRSSQDFFSTYEVDYKSIFTRLAKENTRSTTNNAGLLPIESLDSLSRTLRTPKDINLPDPRHTYTQPYQ
ncbi:hypothetical protein BJX99DRAFT_136865 [Aspergillus californicus]